MTRFKQLASVAGVAALGVMAAAPVAAVNAGDSGAPRAAAVVQGYPVAGETPWQRLPGAPVMKAYAKPSGWYGNALHGVAQPYPSSLGFLEDQANWYTPFIHAGLGGPYDIRHWGVPTTPTAARVRVPRTVGPSPEFIAGLDPDRRPATAPVITQYHRSPGWFGQALHGISTPYPPSLRFLENQANWYTPFNRPGLGGAYDLRHWRAEPDLPRG